MNTEIPLREFFFEEAMERYVDWREACAAVRRAYDQWSEAPVEERPLSFAAYRAALDQEEAAATVYGTVVSRMPVPEF